MPQGYTKGRFVTSIAHFDEMFRPSLLVIYS